MARKRKERWYPVQAIQVSRRGRMRILVRGYKLERVVARAKKLGRPFSLFMGPRWTDTWIFAAAT